LPGQLIYQIALWIPDVLWYSNAERSPNINEEGTAFSLLNGAPPVPAQDFANQEGIIT
jgi:hypothetical protein